MTPVIGITTYEDQASWRGWSARAAMLPYVYVDAVRRSGARAILLPPGGDDDEASATVASLDGLVVSGGPDIDPVRYGAPRHRRDGSRSRRALHRWGSRIRMRMPTSSLDAKSNFTTDPARSCAE